MASLEVEICGVKFKNPVIGASGTVGFGREFNELYDLAEVGGISTKGMTIEPRLGNPVPRIAEGASVILNAVGLQNPGVEHFIKCDLPFLRDKGVVIIANVAGKTLEDYGVICAKLDGLVDMVELNISCPNVHGGGMSFGTDPAAAATVTKAVKTVTTKPVFMKLTPNVTDIVSIAKACEDAGADGISLINTLMGMSIDLRTRRPVLANTTGGLSGPAVKPVALRMVYQVYEAVSIPIIGMGGVATAGDVLEFMLAGAAAVEVGAANVADPLACKKIIDNLPAAMTRYGINDLKEIIGGAHHG